MGNNFSLFFIKISCDLGSILVTKTMQSMSIVKKVCVILPLCSRGQNFLKWKNNFVKSLY